MVPEVLILPTARPAVASTIKSGVRVLPRRARTVLNHSNLCATLVVTGASRPEALAAGLQVAPAQLNVVACPRCCACWASPSIPTTHGPDCQLKPACPPKITPLTAAEVMGGSRGGPVVVSLNTVSVLDLPQP